MNSDDMCFFFNLLVSRINRPFLTFHAIVKNRDSKVMGEFMEAILTIGEFAHKDEA